MCFWLAPAGIEKDCQRRLSSVLVLLGVAVLQLHEQSQPGHLSNRLVALHKLDHALLVREFLPTL